MGLAAIPFGNDPRGVAAGIRIDLESSRAAAAALIGRRMGVQNVANILLLAAAHGNCAHVDLNSYDMGCGQ
jgi:hypothetical protein